MESWCRGLTNTTIVITQPASKRKACDLLTETGDGLLVMPVCHSAIQTATHTSSQMGTRDQRLIYSQI